VSDRILVVDDTHDVADSLVRLLTTLGYEVKAVYDGARAIDAAANFQPDMAFIDIGMPGLDGYEVVRRIRQQRNHIHVILIALTGWAQAADVQQAYNAGFDLHVTKPMGVDKLKELLKLLDPAGESQATKIYRLAEKGA
jgi:CheY-like chemotaxis protein